MNQRSRAFEAFQGGRLTLRRTMVKRALLAVASVAVVFFASNALAGTDPGAAALEARLFAPCCWNGTLDAHDSELARELRKEIEERLARGEKSDDIQADFVSRYGERILAARSQSPIRAMGLSLAGVMVLAAVGLGVVLRRWVGNAEGDPARVQLRRPDENAPRPEDLSKRDALDERLDAELAEID